MQKQAPSVARILSMAVFALSCFALLLFLWLSFGGSTPLKPKSYRVEAVIPEATTLAQEADVRLAGVTIGRVKEKKFQPGGRGTLVTLEIKPRYAPISRTSRLILRQKTLLGETYVEISPGNRKAGTVPDGGRIAKVNVEPTVELDEIFQAFDRETKDAFRTWVAEAATAIDGGTDEDLNDALGNLDEFVVDGADVTGVLDRQRKALYQTIRNTGVVFKALTRRDGELRSLIENSGRTFDAFASRDEALAETFRIFPTFLDESRATLARLQTFSANTRPLVRDLQPVADDLAPTVRDVAGLAPDLRQLFRDLDPLITASRQNTPALRRVLREASPTFDQLDPFLKELNPIISYANYNQTMLATFLNHGPAAFGASLPPLPGTGPRHYLRAYGAINSRSLSLNTTRPEWDRGNSYVSPNTYNRGEALGVVAEAFSCPRGEVRDPVDQPPSPSGPAREFPPCFVQPPQEFNNTQYPRLRRGVAELVPAPTPTSGPPLPDLDG